MEILRSPREIAQMRKAGLLVWEAHQVARPLLRPGVDHRRDRRRDRNVLRRTPRRAAVQGRARHGPLSGGHLHFDQRGGGARHPRPAES